MILKRAVVIVGQEPLGDGKMSTIRKISFIDAEGVPRLNRVQTRYLICKSSPGGVAETFISIVYGLHLNEIAGLRRGRLCPELVYTGVHWTGHYLLLMEFIHGTRPSVSSGINSVQQIDAFIVELARFHRDSLHIGLDDPEWRQLALDGSAGPVVSLLQKFVIGQIWQQTSRQYNPAEVEAQRPLIEYGLAELPEIQTQVLHRFPTVMAHGDLHCGNIIVADDGRFRLVDWQASCVRPIFFDLCYFIGTSVPIQLRREHMDRWLRLYLDEIGLAHTSKEVVDECFAVCLYSVLLPLEFMAFLIKTDSKSGNMHFESSGRRALAMLEDYHTEKQLHALIQSEANNSEKLSLWRNRK